jgi:ankyrin repeat protein
MAETKSSMAETTGSHTAEPSPTDWDVDLSLDYGTKSSMAETASSDIDVNTMFWSAKRAYNATKLFHASIIGLEGVVRSLLAKGADPNLGDTDGRTPLLVASSNGHEEVVKLLIAAGAEPDERADDVSSTALMTASMHGHIDVTRLLIEAGADINAASTYGGTALDSLFDHPFCPRPETTPKEKAVKGLLLAHGALPGVESYPYMPPLHARLLREARTHTPFTLLPEDALPEALPEALPKMLSERDMYGRTALHYAALTGNRDAYTFLHDAMTTMGVDTEVADDGGHTASAHLRHA